MALTLDDACAAACREHAELAIDAGELAATMRAAAGGDLAGYLARCHANDLALALAATRGAAGAIAKLERVHAVTIGAVCHRFAGLGHGVDDLRQILRAHLFVGERPGIAEYAGQGSLGSWLRVTAVRLFIDLSRRKDRAREDALTDATPELVAGDDLALDAIKAECRETVAAALVEAARELAPGDRHLLRQHLVAGLSIDQLGAVLGVHRATAARRISRAREQLSQRARELLANRLAADDRELAEVYGLVISKLDMSMRRLLRTAPA